MSWVAPLTPEIAVLQYQVLTQIYLGKFKDLNKKTQGQFLSWTKLNLSITQTITSLKLSKTLIFSSKCLKLRKLQIELVPLQMQLASQDQAQQLQITQVVKVD